MLMRDIILNTVLQKKLKRTIMKICLKLANTVLCGKSVSGEVYLIMVIMSEQLLHHEVPFL